MKPDFALSLSFDGIALLQRAEQVWVPLGDVPVDAPDLAAQLSDLSHQAKGRSSRGDQVKLIIPNEQIRYLSVPDDGAQGEELEQQVRQALDGATPYSVDELVYDWQAANGALNIAAVARETLVEAEMFAAGHHFTPVCHVAAPDAQDFDGEVFFGPVSGWNGPVPERDDTAVVIGELPEPQPEPEPEVAPEPDAVSQIDTEADAPETVDAAPSDFNADAQVAVAEQEQPSPQVDDGPPPGTTMMEKAVAAMKVANETQDQPVAAGSTIAPSIVDPQEPASDGVAFSSIRAARDSAATGPALTGVTRTEDSTAETPPVAFRNKPKPEPAPVAKPEKRSSKGFFSRRSTAAAAKPTAPVAPSPKAAAPIPVEPPKRVETSALKAKRLETGASATQAAPTKAAQEAERMTIFGARQEQKVGGKPRFLGLMLTLALLAFLAGVAAWAAIFVEDGLAGLFFDKKSDTDVASSEILTSPVDAPSVAAPQTAPASAGDEQIALASLNNLPDASELEPEDNGPTALTAPITPEVMTPEQAEATYAATGFWLRAPVPPARVQESGLGDVYVASIDPKTGSRDAIAMSRPDLGPQDFALAAFAPPHSADKQFDLDPRGLVRATPEGVLNPQGVMVYAGRPALVPPQRPDAASSLNDSPETVALQSRLRAVRPRARPGDLQEGHERGLYGGLTRVELASIRPKLRTITAKDTAELNTTATALAVNTSPRPITRPRDFARLVETARKDPANQKATQVAAVAPRTVNPSIPTTANVAKQATTKNAINLRALNLIGVYGKPNARRALVRLPSGRYMKVEVGDRLDGGRVAAIGEDALRYTKSGRNLTIKMP